MIWMILGGLGLGLVSAFSLYVSTMVRRGAFEPTRRVPPFDLEVIAISGDRVTLCRRNDCRPARRWRQQGVWGLRAGGGGHGRVGEIVADAEGAVTRRWTRFEGEIAPGDAVRVDATAWPLDPEAAFGLDFSRVEYDSPAGRFSGWVSGRDRPTWLLLLHGKRAARPRQPPYAYPVLPVAHRLGLACFEVSYRNDAGAPESDGLHWYGLKEWEDLEAAARYALDHGAGRLVLMGYSMGGGIAVSFLYRSAMARHVAGLILDAPVLDLRAVIDHGIRQKNIPPAIARGGLWLLSRRLGFDWSAFDYLKDADRIPAPVLLLHGEDDPTVPISTSQRLAGMRPDIVRWVRTPGAGHAESWNLAPKVYEREVRLFLEGLPLT